MRCLFAALFVLVGLSVPVAAAAFAPVAAMAPGPSASPTKASVDSWITGAPPPVLVMLLGTLIVTITVMRHLRRQPATAQAGLERPGPRPPVR